MALAILQVNSDTRDATYLDNFSPFIAQALDDLGGHTRGYSALTSKVKEQFGIPIPDGAARSIVERMRERKIVSVDRDEIELNPGVSQDNVGKAIRKYSDQERQFLKRFRTYADARGIATDDDTARATLLDFVAEHGVGLLREHVGKTETTEHADVVEPDLETLLEDDGVAQAGGEPSRDPARSQLRVALALFIWDLVDDADPLVEHIVACVKGTMLASSIYQESDEVIEPFQDVTVYLDTRVIFRALGLSGEEFENATSPTLKLAHSANAKLACFEHTIDEMQDILYAVANTMQGVRRPEQIQEVERYIFSRPDLTYRKVRHLADTLPDRLKKIGVEVVSKPEYDDHQLQIDEEGFREAIREVIGERISPRAVDRDIDSIAAMYRLRDGRKFTKLENCAAIFVTTSSGLVKAARKFFNTRFREVPMAMMESRFQTTVWLKNPIRVDDSFPRNQVIAHCYAALQPNESLWTAYLAKIDEFVKERKNPDADFVYLRYSESAREALMDMTLGNPSLLTQESLVRILRDRDDATLGPLREQIAELESQTAALREQLESTEYKRYTVQQENQSVQAKADALQAEIERLKNKERRAERHRRKTRETLPSTARKAQAEPARTVAAPPAPAVETAPADTAAAARTETDRVDALINYIVRRRVRWVLTAIMVPAAVLIVASLLVVAEPDASYLSFLPGWAKVALIVVSLAIGIASAIAGWSLKKAAGWARQRMETRVRNKMPH